MSYRTLLTTTLLLCAGLTACGGTIPSSSSSSGSGITVFGDIDTSVSRTR